jgi:(5-formylfuran-3-yl)methyl phosphate synthase
MTGTAPACCRFLVSVRNAREARLALDGGADIIDVKEPREGALGAVELTETAAIMRLVAGRRPVSATIGDCSPDEAAERVLRTAITGVDYVKVGLFGDPSAPAMDALERCASDGIRIIAVMFADRAPDWSAIEPLAGCGFRGVMLDTADKAGGGLRRYLSLGGLAAFLAEARRHGLLAGLAGSLREEDARALLPLRPDVMGFRGALCGGGRRGEMLDAGRMAAMRALIPQGPGSNDATHGALMAEEG